MSFENFKSILARKFPDTQFTFTEDDGKYIGEADGVLLIGNSISQKTTVKWGDRHQAQFVLQA